MGNGGEVRTVRSRGVLPVAAMAWSALLMAVAVLVGVPIAPAMATAPSPSAAALVLSAQQAVLHQHSVRWQLTSCTGREPSGCPEGGTLLGVYVGPDGATASVLVAPPAAYRGKVAASRITFLLSGPRIYLNGDVGGLYDYGGLRMASARAEAGRWLAAPASSPAFRQVVLGAQLSEVSTHLGTPATTSSFLSPIRVGGELVRRVRESGAQAGRPVSEVVWVGPAGLPLRASSESSFVAMGKEWWTRTVYTYSGWDRTVPVGVPVHWVPVQAGWLSVPPGQPAMPGPGAAAGLP